MKCPDCRFDNPCHLYSCIDVADKDAKIMALETHINVLDRALYESNKLICVEDGKALCTQCVKAHKFYTKYGEKTVGEIGRQWEEFESKIEALSQELLKVKAQNNRFKEKVWRAFYEGEGA